MADPESSPERLAELLALREAEVEALVAGAHVLLTATSFRQAARDVFDQARRITGASSGYVALLSADGQENDVLFLEAGGLACTVDPSLPMPIRGLRNEAYQHKRTVVVNGFADSEWARFLPPGHVRLNNVLFAPLVVGERVVGVMGLANKPQDFGERDVQMAGVFGQMAAAALQKTRTTERLEETVRQLRVHNDLLQEAKATIESLMHTDALTGTATRRLFDELLDRQLGAAARDERPFCLLMADLDHFKRINDDFGHQAGDEVLRAFGQMLLSQVRPGDVVSRFGGEEFLILLPESDLEGAIGCAQRLRMHTAALRFEQVDRSVTVSIGVTQHRREDTEVQLRQRADRALYDAKDGGRDRVAVR